MRLFCDVPISARITKIRPYRDLVMPIDMAVFTGVIYNLASLAKAVTLLARGTDHDAFLALGCHRLFMKSIRFSFVTKKSPLIMVAARLPSLTLL